MDNREKIEKRKADEATKKEVIRKKEKEGHICEQASKSKYVVDSSAY